MIGKTIHKVINKFGYKLSKIQAQGNHSELLDYPCIDLLELVVQHTVKTHSDFFFIQIGAHDGSSADPATKLIQKYQWRGILVEPQPYPFNQLVKNYQEAPQLIFEQAVIAPEDGTTSFYQVRDDIPNLPFWLSQSSSLDRERVRGALYYWKHNKQLDSIPDDLDSAIVEVKVPALTIQSLMAKHNVKNLDFLMLGTPGYDFEILKNFPFEQIKPSIICFEYLSLPDHKGCMEFLADHGYSVGRFAVRAVAALNIPTINWTIYQWSQY
ncbi:MAG: FkbM family methyltransferase [Leptolyngbyaceae cyanobacterium bins.302]|nr:FkbM family methyltransferase [Leptolyngbyaceae cyanobacterium bins.302]